MPRHHQTESGSSKDFDRETLYDKLTELPNRHLLYDRLGQEMASSKRTGRYIALMSIGLVDFQPLNDSHSQKIGDLLLFEVANRLKDNVREVDTVARTGSDEFVVILNELTREKTQSVTQSHIIAEKIHTALTNSYPIFIKYKKNKDIVDEYSCTISMGVVVFTNNNERRDDVLEWAERSMHKAKESGGSQICFNDTYEYLN
jgi:diguanylate cyclase (GGDEF)-like protein